MHRTLCVGVSPEEPQVADTYPKCLLCILETVDTAFRELVRYGHSGWGVWPLEGGDKVLREPR